MIKTIDDLYTVNYGQKEYESKDDLTEGDTMLISSAGEDNGSFGFFDVPAYYKAPFITVPRTGTIGQAFVQLNDCSANSDVMVLIPKTKLTIEELYQTAFQIRLNKWKYAYGRKITPERLKSQKIRLEQIPTNFKKLFDKLTPDDTPKKSLEKRRIKLVNITELCTIEKTQGIPQSDITSEGNIPYVSSSSRDNGIVFFSDEKPNAEAKSLTVAKDGNDGYSFYQPYPFLTSIHNYVLRPKNNYPSYLLLYVGAVVKIRAYCYNHYYPLSRKHLERIGIPMPLNDKGDYDFEYIRQMVEDSYGGKEMKQYL